MLMAVVGHKRLLHPRPNAGPGDGRHADCVSGAATVPPDANSQHAYF